MGKPNVPISRNTHHPALFTQSVHADLNVFLLSYTIVLVCVCVLLSVSDLQVHATTTQTSPCMCLGVALRVAAMLPSMICGDWT